VDDDGSLVILQNEITDADIRDVEQAVSSCPTEALRISR
jgi:ferredoxin